MLSLVSLFTISVLAATILPAQSEIVLAGLLAAESAPVWVLVLVASVGNTLGSCINWMLGRWIEHFRGRKWFPASEASLEKASGWYRRYGKWSLLLSWAPFIGDPLTLAAGILREPFPMFLLLVSIAKLGRYVIVAGLVKGFL
ncbi:YqaA family protein [Roseibium limicola]|uniref:DedA family protein n=1 Tax=Roseibium limicola TaxID=2816037 RepID=A0A939ER09_9HYPH|nr:DedA family protein [Roseibium limicola]